MGAFWRIGVGVGGIEKVDVGRKLQSCGAVVSTEGHLNY